MLRLQCVIGNREGPASPLFLVQPQYLLARMKVVSSLFCGAKRSGFNASEDICQSGLGSIEKRTKAKFPEDEFGAWVLKSDTCFGLKAD